MAILWCGGEDIDFPNGGATVQTTAGYFRSGYARCCIYSNQSKSLGFANGPVTSCWLSFQAKATNSTAAPVKIIGLGSSTLGGADGSGIWLATTSSATYRLALCKFDNTTLTQLAAEPGASLTNGLVKIDMQIISYGASGTVRVFANGVQVISYTGDIRGGVTTNLDCVLLGQITFNNTWGGLSEIIVADEDTRSMALVTMAPNATGTTDQWTGTVTNMGTTTLSDVTPNWTNVSLQDQQANLIDPPTTSLAVRAVKIAARGAIGTGSTPTKLALGYNSGGSVAVGASQALTNSFTTYEELDATNPVTSAAWSFSDLAGLQVDLRSEP